MAKLTKMALIQKIIEARVVLYGMSVKHKGECGAITDPESFAPCTCGANLINDKINSAIQILTLE